MLFLLCVGVLLVGVTFHGSADSYTVSAVVEAPLPTAPAVITDPADQMHFTSHPIAVKGTCQSNTYVKLNRNGVLSGVAICGAGQTSFEIDTDLSLGSNVLLPQIYNITDQAGPVSSPITVFLDNPPSPPASVPPSVPVVLQVTSQDGIAFRSGNIAQVSPYVTERGIAPPYSHVVVTFHSTPLTCQADADGNGNWSCKLDQALPNGQHMVQVVATTLHGQTLTFPPFYVIISAAIAPLQPVNSLPPFLVTTDFRYQAHISGQPFGLDLGLSGGTGPYAVTVDWGDGRQSTFARKDTSKFSAQHTYKLSKRNQQTYLVKINAVDSDGSTAFLEVAERVNASGSAVGLPVIGDTGINIPPISQLQQWLWLVWPAYGVVSLMVLSFWLGERQEYHNLFTHRRRA